MSVAQLHSLKATDTHNEAQGNIDMVLQTRVFSDKLRDKSGTLPNTRAHTIGSFGRHMPFMAHERYFSMQKSVCRFAQMLNSSEVFSWKLEQKYRKIIGSKLNT